MADGVEDWEVSAHAALERMRRAHDRKTGCRLTAEMVNGLALTGIGAMWTEESPFLQKDEEK